MAELADALASGASGGNPVEVQVLLPALRTLYSLSVECFFVSILKKRRQGSADALFT